MKVQQSSQQALNQQPNKQPNIKNVSKDQQSKKVEKKRTNLTLNPNNETKEPTVVTDPNSLYRKLYNRSLDFFLWVIDVEQPPYTFKLHVQSLSKNEIKPIMVKRSIEFLIPPSLTSKPKVDVQFFSKKKQFKVFVDIYEKAIAKQFFRKVFSSKTLWLLDSKFEQEMIREMRAYLVKSEEEFQQLAMVKYQEEILIAKEEAAKRKK